MNSEELLKLESIGVSNTNNNTNQIFFSVSIQKLVIMSIFTLGYYEIYWLYQNFKINKEKTGDTSWPIARAFFYIFFTHSLFKSISATAIEKEITTDFQSSQQASDYIWINIFARFLGKYSDKLIVYWPNLVFITFLLPTIIHFCGLFPLCKAQTLINTINNDSTGTFNSKFSTSNIIFILIGSLIWGFLFFNYYEVLAQQYGFSFF